jgi:hypothetical protein
MNVRPFRLVGESDRVALRSALRDSMSAWVQAWFSQAPQVNLEFDSQPETGIARGWLAVGELPDRWIAWRQDSALAKAMLRHLFPGTGAGSSAGSLGDAVVRDCMADLAGSCLAAAGMPANSLNCDPTSLPVGYGSGSQFARLTGDSFDQALAFGGAVVEALAAASRPIPAVGSLQARLSAIGAGKVRLEVTLGDAELSLAELASIAVGDVIALDSSPRDPLAVRTGDGQPAFHAHLGRNAERKVLQVSGK